MFVAAFETMYLTFVIYAVLQVCVYGHALDPDKITDVAEMRKALKDVLEINQRLDWQNRRSLKVWSGLLQMCNGLSLTTDQHQDNNLQEETLTFQQTIPGDIYMSESSQTASNRKTQNLSNQDITIDQIAEIVKEPLQINPMSSTNDKFDQEVLEVPLRIQAVSSTSDSYLNVTITYTAPDQHSTAWLARLDRKGELRSAGNRRSTGTTYSVYEVFYEPETIEELHFHVHAGTRSVHVLLNVLDLSDPGEQLIPDYPRDVVFQRKEYTSSVNNDVEIQITFQEPMEANIITTGTHATFTGLNASSYPVKILRYSNSDKNMISLVSNATGNESTAVITIKADVAQFGGLLTVRPPSLTTIGGFVLHLNNEQYVTIKAASSGVAFPKDTVALFSNQKQILVDTEFYSVSCSAIGNPEPEVKLFRQLETGERNEVIIQTVLADQYRTEVTHTLSSSDKSERVYICSAASGNQTVEEAMEVLFVKPLVFNTTNTRVLKDDNDTIVIACEAMGHPLPHVDLQINNGSLSSLTSLKTTFEVERSSSDDTSSLTVKLTKPSFDLPQLECVGKQSGRGDIITITVYPEGDKD